MRKVLCMMVSLQITPVSSVDEVNSKVSQDNLTISYVCVVVLLITCCTLQWPLARFRTPKLASEATPSQWCAAISPLVCFLVLRRRVSVQFFPFGNYLLNLTCYHNEWSSLSTSRPYIHIAADDVRFRAAVLTHFSLNFSRGASTSMSGSDFYWSVWNRDVNFCQWLLSA